MDETTTFGENDDRSTLPRFTKEALKANRIVVRLLEEIAERKAPLAQIALVWLLAQMPWIVPIPGTTKLHRLEENIVAVEISLSAEDLHELTAGISTIEVMGDRYPPIEAAKVSR